MSKFNTKGTNAIETSNMEGGKSYIRKDVRKEITSVILNSMLKGDLYYQKESDRIGQILDLIKSAIDSKNIEFLLKSMIYTRTVANLRSVTHLMAIGILENTNNNPLIRKAITKTIIRPDDSTEMVSLWNARHNKSDKSLMVPNALRRAIRDVFESKFDEYQFKKYASSTSKVKLSDVVKLCHPRGRFELFKNLIEGTLPEIATMQTKLSGGEKANIAFKELLVTRKLGYMAAIKNIRNAIENGLDDEGFELWVKFITNDNAIANSKMLPFRYVDAWNEISKLTIDEFRKESIRKALETAFAKSAMNTELIDSNDKIAIILDESGSMCGQPFDIGKTLAASTVLCLGNAQVLFYSFAEDCRKIEISEIKESPFNWINNFNANGGGTHFSAPMKRLIETNTKVDKIIVFTDMQMYSANRNSIFSFNSGDDKFKVYYDQYKEINPEVKLLFWNLQGYPGGTPLYLNKDITEVAGYSDSMLKVIAKIWNDPDFLIKEIESITI